MRFGTAGGFPVSTAKISGRKYPSTPHQVFDRTLGGMKNTQIGELDVILAMLILFNPSAYKP